METTLNKKTKAALSVAAIALFMVFVYIGDIMMSPKYTKTRKSAMAATERAAFVFLFSVVSMAPSYTLSMFFSPKSPVGLTMRMTIRRTKVKASENVVHPAPLMRFSQIPITKAPTTAPGTDPIPPNTAATKALRPGMAPDIGLMPV